jgi:hypothetical protein
MKQDAPALPNNWSSWGKELSENEEELCYGAHNGVVHDGGSKSKVLMFCPASLPRKLYKSFGCDYAILGDEIQHMAIVDPP